MADGWAEGTLEAARVTGVQRQPCPSQQAFRVQKELNRVRCIVDGVSLLPDGD